MRLPHALLSPILLAPLLFGSAGSAGDIAQVGVRLPRAEQVTDERILHALNRLGFGPRPGQPAEVRALGLSNWIDRQLRPEVIPDPEIDRLLRDYTTLGMEPVELLVAHPPPQLLQAMGRRLDSRMGMSAEAIRRMFPELEWMEERKKQRDGEEQTQPTPAERMRRVNEGPGRIALELQQAKLVRAAHSERQLQEVMTDFWFNHFNVYINKNLDRWWTSSYERDAIRPHALGNFRDLLGATARHPAMLFYLDNWLSTAPGADVDRRTLESYASRAIREQELPPGGVVTLILRERGMDTGSIERQIERRERAMASGRSSARSRADAEAVPSRTGLNENYARELLELHTLGVDSGYSQQDIVEVARCFTGWTLLPLHAGQEFVFVREMHDRGKKTVLGRKVKGAGAQEGEWVLDLLASDPRTARFISTKIARRFVSDEPPGALVDRMAARFLATDGDIREVLLTLFESEEFWSPAATRAKVKTPFEYVVSMLRATDAQLAALPSPTAEATSMQQQSRRPGALGALRELGQPLYGAQPPTGYGDTAEAWISTGALLNRLKVAAGFASGKLPGIDVDLDAFASAGGPVDEHLVSLGLRLLGRPPSEATVQSIQRQLELPPEELEQLGLPAHFLRNPAARDRLAVAWMLASPEFQRR